MRQRIGAGDDGLARDDRRQRRQNDQRNAHGLGRHQEEPVLIDERLARRCGRFQRRQRERALAEIVERQRRKRQREPAELNRRATKMAHIGGQCFGAGYRQEHSAQHEQPDNAVSQQEADPVAGDQHAEDGRFVGDMINAEACQRQKPQHANGAEQLRNARGAARLDQEQPDQNGDRERDNGVFAEQCFGARNRLQALDRRQHRKRRRDDCITVEERSARPAERERNGRACASSLRFAQRASRERGQRQHAAFALIVGTGQEQHIFQTDNDNQRPDREAEHAQDRACVDLVARGVERFTKRIKRAGANIAEHNPDRAQRKRQGGKADPRRAGGRMGSGKRNGHGVARPLRLSL